MKKGEENLKKVYDFACQYITDNGFPPSVREICANVGVKSTATVYNYLEKLKNQGLLKKMPSKKRAITLTNAEKQGIPILGVIRAGAPIYAEENILGYCPNVDFISKSEDCFALNVVGNSMIKAGIYEGDTILVKKCQTANNGDIVVALLQDEATVKRFYLKDDYIVLHPENDEMQDIITKDAVILGIVKGLIRKF